MRAHHTRFLCAILFAHFCVRFTLAVRVAGFLALVLAAFERLVARQTATEIALTAWNNFALFVLAIAILRGECHAGRAILGRMTVVRDGVLAWMRSRTRFIAHGTLCAAWNGRVNYVRTTFTMQFVE